MSRFGGPSSKAAVSIQETFHGNIIEPIFKGDPSRPHQVTVELGGSGVILRGVYYAKPLGGQPIITLIGRSVQVSKIGGRWAVL